MTPPLNLPVTELKIKKQNGKDYVLDRLRKQFFRLTPEEYVRQQFVSFLIEHKGYPSGRLANEIEIIEAEEEGVIFKNLTNPIEITGTDGKVNAVRLQIMELGEPDASGRRSPVAIDGKEEIIEVDAVITAIGLKTDNQGLEELELSRWGTIIADERTFRTNLDGVFAIGDASNKGADIAIAAIGEAKQAA
jgi:NADPH-dependent glutamate synthase beta subunit-like oxidoreductase